jgi:hypothetical protein
MGFLKDYISPSGSKKGAATDDARNGATTAPQDLAPAHTRDVPSAWPALPDNFSVLSSRDYSTPSRTNSLYPQGDFRNANPETIQEIKCEVMVNWLHSKQEEQIWTTGEPGEGVVLKKSKGRYVCCPSELSSDGSALFKAVSALNVRVCLCHRLITQVADLPSVQ